MVVVAAVGMVVVGMVVVGMVVVGMVVVALGLTGVCPSIAFPSYCLVFCRLEKMLVMIRIYISLLSQSPYLLWW